MGDNVLLSVAIIAVVVSTLGFFVIYSVISPLDVRLAPENATVNVTIQTNAAVNFSVNNINFGSGYHLPGVDSVVLSTHDGSNGTLWNTVPQGFVLDNVGTINVTLRLYTTKNATQFIGGGDGVIPDPLYQYNVTNIGLGSCTPHPSFSLGQYYDTNNTSPGTQICGNGASGPGFGYLPGQDSLEIDILLRIPQDTPFKDTPLGDTMTAVAAGIA